jgi:hypothetical protein
METKVKLKIVTYPKVAGKTRGGIWVKAIMHIDSQNLIFKFQKPSILKSLLLARLPIQFDLENQPKKIKKGLFGETKVTFEKKYQDCEITLKKFESKELENNLLSWPS